MKRGNSYAPEEDEIILRETSHEAHRKLSGRTFLAIKQRKNVLTHPEPEPTKTQAKICGRIWGKADEEILRRIWPAAETIEEVQRRLPGYTKSQIRSKAGHLQVKRWFNGAADVPVKGHKELLDQIRIRSKQDGISLSKLDKLLGCGCYFRTASWRRTRINLVHVAHAIEFFGGTLVIDWCDR